MSTLKVSRKVNIFGSMVVRRLPSSAPPTPAKNAPRQKESTLVLKVSMPMTFAAISSSRMALKMLPKLLPRSLTMQYRVMSSHP